LVSAFRHIGWSSPPFGVAALEQGQILRRFRKVSFSVAKRSRDEFYPKKNLQPSRLSGADMIVKDAIALKFLNALLSEKQLAEFFQYQMSRSQY